MTPAEVLAQLFPYFTLLVTVAPLLALLWFLRSLHVKVKWLVQVMQAMTAAAAAAEAELPAAKVTPLHPGTRRTGR